MKAEHQNDVSLLQFSSNHWAAVGDRRKREEICDIYLQKISGQNYLSWVKVKRVRKKKSLQRTKQKKVEIKIRLRVKMTETPGAVSSENKSSPFNCWITAYLLFPMWFWIHTNTAASPENKIPFSVNMAIMSQSAMHSQKRRKSAGKINTHLQVLFPVEGSSHHAPPSRPSVQSNTSILTSCYLPDK